MGQIVFGIMPCELGRREYFFHFYTEQIDTTVHSPASWTLYGTGIRANRNAEYILLTLPINFLDILNQNY
jgi:hypothetical protein